MYEVFFFVHRLDGKNVFIDNVSVTNLRLIRSMFETYNESKNKGFIYGYHAKLAYCPAIPIDLF